MEEKAQDNTSHASHEMITTHETDDGSIHSTELTMHNLDLECGKSNVTDLTPPKDDDKLEMCNSIRSPAPLIIFSRPTSIIMQHPEAITLHSNLQSLKSLVTSQPQSLFLQALSKLNESSLSIAINNNLLFKNSDDVTNKLLEPSTPDSLTNAPPSYSFVLRQISRRRPRLMGTFIPSPSFVQHTPPPNYAAAFDIYVDTPIQPPTSRVYNFGFTPIPVMCPECGYTGMTTVTCKITLCTHLCAFLLCIFLCWVCVPLPYVLRSCKDVYHYCRNCRSFLGLYRPAHPENAYS
ncbi:unnamed protein product [Leptidea sinapis]|uniref:LITAF domain-containing protein n=1 Tax=Leptidea sinapis TaxID=189913 RepID=A0A5E4PZE9_9NEOP|nr:unnamed protein product [Leptidea sinapis]